MGSTGSFHILNIIALFSNTFHIVNLDIILYQNDYYLVFLYSLKLWLPWSSQHLSFNGLLNNIENNLKDKEFENQKIEQKHQLLYYDFIG